MLGTALLSELIDSTNHEVYATSRSKGLEDKNIKWQCFDLTNMQQLESWLQGASPDIVIHCAAMVNVDQCEKEPNQATELHIVTTEKIANYVKKNNKRLVYISTDSVFDGRKNKPYIEDDQTAPLNVYAKTKLLGEKSILSLDKGVVLRTNIVGCTYSKRPSFVEWIIQELIKNETLPLFKDVIFSPIHVKALSKIITKIINSKISGLYHCAGKGFVSKYEFGMQIAQAFNFPINNIKKISIDDMNFKAKRPKNMAINSKKISLALRCNLPTVEETIDLIKISDYPK